MLNNTNLIQSMVNETMNLSDSFGCYEESLSNFLKIIPDFRKSKIQSHKEFNFARVMINNKLLDIPLKCKAFQKLKSKSLSLEIKHLNQTDQENSFGKVISRFLGLPVCPTFISYKHKQYLVFFTEFEIKKLDQLMNKKNIPIASQAA